MRAKTSNTKDMLSEMIMVSAQKQLAFKKDQDCDCEPYPVDEQACENKLLAQGVAIQQKTPETDRFGFRRRETSSSRP